MSWFSRDPEPCPPVAPTYPRFCSRCGSALTYSCDPIGFDEQTGAPKFYRWAHCPKWTGEFRKLAAPGYVETAAQLNADFTARLYSGFGWGDLFYLTCAPAYKEPKSKKADAA